MNIIIYLLLLCPSIDHTYYKHGEFFSYEYEFKRITSNDSLEIFGHAECTVDTSSALGYTFKITSYTSNEAFIYYYDGSDFILIDHQLKTVSIFDQDIADPRLYTNNVISSTFPTFLLKDSTLENTLKKATPTKNINDHIVLLDAPLADTTKSRQYFQDKTSKKIVGYQIETNDNFGYYFQSNKIYNIQSIDQIHFNIDDYNYLNYEIITTEMMLEKARNLQKQKEMQNNGPKLRMKNQKNSDE